MASSFTSPLLLKDIDTYKFELLEPFTYEIGYLGSKISIVVPQGFVTDFASIPSFCTFLFPKFGNHNKAAVLHDWLYQKVRDHEFPRLLADSLFLFAMIDLGVSKWRAWGMFVAVRLFGWTAIIAE